MKVRLGQVARGIANAVEAGGYFETVHPTPDPSAGAYSAVVVMTGGTAQTFAWHSVGALPSWTSCFVAGGLTPDNVSQALRLTRAQGVDVSSGVESAPGVKDPELIRKFIARATAPIL